MTTGTLSPDHVALVRSALGLPNRRRQSYRNHFVDATHPDWEAMVAAGLATVRRSTEPDGPHTYRLTRAGAEAALLPGETLNLDHFPHLEGGLS